MSMAASLRFSDAVVVMGVASCGKTTIGEALAQQLRVAFTEGDKLHSTESVAKMSAGIPLTDDDRWPWLARVGAALQGVEGHIVSCSALKRSYRSAIITAAKRPVKFVHLHGSREVLQQRIAARKGHFMPPSLLDSQLATLELPGADEEAISIDIDQSAERIVAEALKFLAKERK
jgi:carbohydrate kinase (thermoresistant glucokinase family)